MDTVAAAAAVLLFGVLGKKLILGVLSKGALNGAAGVAGVAGSAGVVTGDDALTDTEGVEGTFELGAEEIMKELIDRSRGWKFFDIFLLVLATNLNISGNYLRFLCNFTKLVRIHN
jgi:hypothetical protein